MKEKGRPDALCLTSNRGPIDVKIMMPVLMAAAALLWMLPRCALGASGPSISSISNPVFVGDSFTITGTGFTKGSVVNFFVATSTGPVNFGPLNYSAQTTTSLTVPVPAGKVTTLGQGVVSVVVVNTDQGFAQSNAGTAQLFGDNKDGFPNLMTINGAGLAATSTNPSFAVDNVQTVVGQNQKVTLGGDGFDTQHGVAIDLFCDCPGGKMSTIFLNPGNPGLTATALSFTLPASTATGPGAFVVSNKGANSDYAIKSNAVSVVVGATLKISSDPTRNGCTVTVNGTGFAVTGNGLPPFTVINLFNQQGGTVVNLGGLNSAGAPKIPLNITSSTQFTFDLTGTGAASGPAYVQVFNPPFLQYTSSGDTPNGSFQAVSCGVSTALWVENAIGNFVSEFAGATLSTPGVSAPTPNVTNSSPAFVDPAGVAFDGSNNQWVTVCGSKTNSGSITEFKPATLHNLPAKGAPAPDVLLTDDGTGKVVNCPWALTFNGQNLWVANSNEMTSAPHPPGFVTEYTQSQLGTSGHPTPNITLTDPTELVSATGVVFDSGGDLFVSDFGPEQFGTFAAGNIWVFKAATIGKLVPGTNSVKADARLSDSSMLTPVNGAFDKNGNLWVADCEANGVGEIYMFPQATLISGATKAITIFQSTKIATANGSEDTLDCPGGIAFDADGNLWYTNFTSVAAGTGGVGEFTASQLSAVGVSSPKPNILLEGNQGGTNFDAPIGLTFGPGA